MVAKYPLIALTGVLTSLVTVYSLKKASLRHKFISKSGIPLIGGIGIGAAFFLSSFLGFLPSPGLSFKAIGILFSSFLILFFGAMDDILEYSVSAKFLIQFVAAAVLISFGVRAHIFGLGKFLNILVTFIWILGITNSLNHLDVLDGLAGGVALVTGSAFFAVSLLNADFTAAILSLALISGVLSFLIFNLPPAKVYMGNAGSHFLGFILGAIALNISYAGLNNKIALLAPILILGFPIIDTVMLVFLRMQKRISPFKKSNDHPALRFLASGYSKKKALLVMLAWCLFFSFCGALLIRATNAAGSFIILISIFSALLLFKKISKAKVNA